MITIKGLDFTMSRNWIKRAGYSREDDPIGSFIFAWISFNHYYSTFALENTRQFKDWSRKYFSGRQGDKVELLYLVHSDDFVDALANFESLYPERLSHPIELPIIDVLRGSRVPKNIKGTRRLSDLSNVDLFRVMYQIRNNLFHGSKDPVKSQRDLVLCEFASDFMVPLVAFLLTNTCGEVLNAYDEPGRQLREEVARLVEG